MPNRSHRQTGGQQWVILTTFLLLLVAASGCNPPLEDIGNYPAPPPTQKLATLMAGGIATVNPEYPAPEQTATHASRPIPDAVQAAKYYLAGRLEMPPETISLVSWETSVWSGNELGCLLGPSATEQAPPAVGINGYRIFYRAAGEQYELHSDDDGGNICLSEAVLPVE